MYWIKQAKLRQIQQHLKKGGVIAYATESCFGFGCNPFNYKAISKVIRLKRRSKTKGMILISGQQKHISNVVTMAVDRPEFNQYWPGPYSLILPLKKGLPRNLTGSHDSLAIRLTRHRQVQQLTRFLAMPLVSTSANRAGFKSVKTFRECAKQFGRQVMVINGITNFAKKPSTIIDWRSRTILR